MKLRIVFALVAFVPAVPAAAAELMQPRQAHQFVAGKYFSYTCFEGTSGHGRINPDGSVAGTVRVKGNGPPRFVKLPPGTIKVSETSICASVRGMSMQPCFTVQQLDSDSFRGSVNGMGFAYCTFKRSNSRIQVAEVSEDMPSRPASVTSRRVRPIQSAEAVIDIAPEAAREPLKSETPQSEAPKTETPAQPPVEELKLRPSKND